MDVASITKEFIGLQKQSFNKLIGTVTVFQDQAEKTHKLWADQMGISENAQQFMDQWRTVLAKDVMTQES